MRPTIKVTVEGVAGSGKTSVARGLALMLQGYGFKDVLVYDIDPAPPPERVEMCLIGLARADAPVEIDVVTLPRKEGE